MSDAPQNPLQSPPQSCVLQASAVAIDGRVLLIEGAPGAGKSSLALALIHRGAALVGDDGVTLTRGNGGKEAQLIASPPPNIEGLLEVRGVGLVRFPVAAPAPVALILNAVVHHEEACERLPEHIESRTILGCSIPVLPFHPGLIAPAERALAALQLHGLA